MPRRLRLAFAVLVGLVAGAAAWARVAQIGPHLEIAVRRHLRTEDYDILNVEVRARGGGSVGEVRIEPFSGPVQVAGHDRIPNLKSGWMHAFRVRLDDGRTSKGAVHVIQSEPAPVTYHVPLEEGR